MINVFQNLSIVWNSVIFRLSKIDESAAENDFDKPIFFVLKMKISSKVLFETTQEQNDDLMQKMTSIWRILSNA